MATRIANARATLQHDRSTLERQLNSMRREIESLSVRSEEIQQWTEEHDLQMSQLRTSIADVAKARSAKVCLQCAPTLPSQGQIQA